MIRFALLLTLVSAGVAHGQSPIEKQFIGTWRLVGSTQKLADGTIRPSPAYGPNQLGYMIYTADLHICSVTVKADRPAWQSPRPTDAELKSAWDGLGSYCGTWTVNAAEKSIVHHVEFDKSPNAAGADRKRFFTFEGNRLLLVIAPDGAAPGNGIVNTITWERVAK